MFLCIVTAAVFKCKTELQNCHCVNKIEKLASNSLYTTDSTFLASNSLYTTDSTFLASNSLYTTDSTFLASNSL
jgi:hypothetical protein